MRHAFYAALTAVLFSGCAFVPNSTAQESSHQTTSNQSKTAKPHTRLHPNYKPYDADARSMVEIDKALARARIRGTKVMVVMGANWCHDSRGFAARMDKPEFQTLINDNYELVYASAGTAPRQKDQNRDVSKRFGVDAIEGTPTVFIAKPDGTVLNADSAGYWRRADSIPVDMSYAYFEMYAGK